MEYQIKSITGHEGYKVDTNGEVWSLWGRKRLKKGNGSYAVVGKTKRLLKHCRDKDGYFFVRLRVKKKKYKNWRVSRLVLSEFVGEAPLSYQACHNNGEKTDNRLKNLRWDSVKNNHLDKVKHGTDRKAKGEGCARLKLKEKDVWAIKFLLEEGLLNQHEIGQIFDVGHGTISAIHTGCTWKHLQFSL